MYRIVIYQVSLRRHLIKYVDDYIFLGDKLLMSKDNKVYAYYIPEKDDMIVITRK